MERLLTSLVVALALLTSTHAQVRSGTVIFYRLQGKNLLFAHYSQGEHPTVVCDGTKIARLAENRKVIVTMPVGSHTCAAEEKQFPGTMDASSAQVQVTISNGATSYVRLESHVAFVMREVSPESAALEVAKTKFVKDSDSFATASPGEQPVRR